MQLLLTHHKNQQSWKQAPIHVDTYRASTTVAHMARGSSQRTLPIPLAHWRTSMPLCIHGQAWEGLSTNALRKWWMPWVKAHGGVEHLPPSTYRHIFVDERRSDGRADGPQDKGASMAMGNSLKAWDKHYDKQRHFRPKDCQAAVNAMDI